MPENILVDLNIIIDVLLERRGFEGSREILELGELGSHRLYISGHMVTTFAYILEGAKVPRHEIIRHIDWMLRLFALVPTDEVLLKAALRSSVTDYEDAVVEQAAVSCSATAIITQNTRHFKNSVVRALTPEEYLKVS